MQNSNLSLRALVAGINLRLLSTCILLLLSLSLTFTMCKQPEEVKVANHPFPTAATIAHHDKLKREFGKMFAKVLFEDKNVRALIKEEALKQFNHDYEVLYHMIKGTPLSGGNTLRKLLLDNSGNEPLLKEIEKELPLLTILVPELPENSFSAANWDVETQLPVVGLRVKSDKGVPILVGNGEEFYLPYDLTPGFPVVVVKDNERVTTSNVAGKLTFKAPNSNFFFKFTDANFDNLKGGTLGKDPVARFTLSIDQKIIDARNSMDPVDGWQRDYIYYNLTPTRPKGPFSLAFKEKITSFTFNYGKEAYTKISEQGGDPKYYGAYESNSNTAPAGAAAWTEGSFEFLINALINSKATGQPAIAPQFPARGYDLFILEYELIFYAPCKWYQGCFGKDLYVYRVKNVFPKTHFLPNNVEIINWDLDKFAPTMIITIKEMDTPQTVTTKESSSTEFAGNFGIDQEDGIFKKIGLKFGASLKKIFASERTVVTSLDSDELGNTIVEFGDKVIIGQGNVHPLLGGGTFYQTREYSTGWVSFSIEPIRVQ
jgi:hypothetical protein